MTKHRLLSLVVTVAVLFTAGLVTAQQPTTPAAPPAPPPDYGAPITNEQSKKVMAGAEAEAKKNKWNVVITILDSGGQLMMMQRLDGAQWGSVDISREKAKSAVALRRPTKALQDLIAQGGAKAWEIFTKASNPQPNQFFSLDPAIDVVEFAPFAHGDRLAILAGHARQTALLIHLTTIRTAVGGIDKAIRQFSRIQGHPGCRCCSYQGHNHGRPAEGSPA